MLIDKIKELNDALYAAFGELAENKSHITSEKYRDKVAEKLMELYELEYKLVRGELVEEDYQADMLARRKELMTPQKWRFIKFWKRANRAEKVTSEDAWLNAMQFFDKKQAALDELEEAIRAADEATTAEAMEEPADNPDVLEQRDPEETKKENEPAGAQETHEKQSEPDTTAETSLTALKKAVKTETPRDLSNKP